MANLPQPLESTGAAVEPLPTPYSNLRPPRTGTQVAGEALQQGSKLLGDVANAHQEEMNAAQIADGEAKMITSWRTMFDDPDNGFKLKKGLEARRALPQYTEQLQGVIDDAVSTGSTPAAQRALRMRGALVMKDWERVAGGHAIGEEERYKDQAFKGRVEAGLTDVSNSWADLSLVNSKLQRMRPYVQAEAERQGDSEDEAGRWTKVQQEAAKGVLAQLVAHRDVEGAQTYLGQVSDLLGPEATKWTREVELLGAHVGAFSDARKIADGARVPGTPLVDEEKALAAWQALPDKDPERKEKAWELIQRQVQAGHAAQTQANGGAFNRVLSAYEQGKQIDPADEAALLAPNNAGGAALWDHFREIRQRDANHLRLLQEREAKPTAEEEVAYAKAADKIINNWQEYAAKDPAAVAGEFGAQVTRSQLKGLLTLQTKTVEQANSKEGVALPAMVNRQVTDQLAKARGFPSDTKKYSDDQWLVFNHALTVVNQREKDWYAIPDHKGKPVPEDYNRWIGDALLKGEVKGTGRLWDDTVTRAEAESNPRYQGKAFVPSIPKPERAQISQAFQARFKRAPTDAEIERMFRLRHNLPVGQ